MIAKKPVPNLIPDALRLLTRHALGHDCGIMLNNKPDRVVVSAS